MIRALVHLLILACLTSFVRADAANDQFREMCKLAERAAADQHVDMKHYMLSGRSWLSAEGEWTICFAGWGPRKGHYVRVLIRDDTKKAKVLVDK